MMVTKAGYRKAKVRFHLVWNNLGKDWRANVGVSTVFLYPTT